MLTCAVEGRERRRRAAGGVGGGGVCAAAPVMAGWHRQACLAACPCVRCCGCVRMPRPFGVGERGGGGGRVGGGVGGSDTHAHMLQ